MNQTCKRIEEALACGQNLSGAQRLHVADCESCLATQTLSQSLKTTLGAIAEPAIPLGFTTRLEARVHSRIYNHRMVGLRHVVLAIGGVLAAIALLLTLRSARTMSHSNPALTESTAEISTNEQPGSVLGSGELAPEGADFVADLVLLADVEKSLRISANWNQYLEPVAAIEILAKELEQ